MKGKTVEKKKEEKIALQGSWLNVPASGTQCQKETTKTTQQEKQQQEQQRKEGEKNTKYTRYTNFHVRHETGVVSSV